MDLAWKRSLFAFSTVAGLLVCALPAPGQPPGLGKRPPILFVLMVIDNHPDLAYFVEADRKSLTKILTEGFSTRPHRLSVEVLEQRDAKPEAVLSHIKKNLARRVIADYNTVLFYYGGHGANVVGKGHCLTMLHGILPRNDLIRELKSLNPRLIAVLTDCCSNYVLIKNKAGSVRPNPKATWPVMDQLFFSHKGIADINGCQAGAFSWNFEDRDGVAHGGTFSVALAPLLCARPEAFGSKDGFVTWATFVPRLQQDTNRLFQQLKTAALKDNPKDEIGKQGAQIPEVFSLGVKAKTTIVDPPWMFGALVGEDPKGKVAGVTIAKVYPDTPAASVDFQNGDVIVKIDDRPTPTSEDFTRAIDYSEGEITLSFLRGGEERSARVKLQPVKSPPPIK